MPRYAMDYSKTKLYKIVCRDLTIKDCYVGHTTDFASRKSDHKRNSINEKSNQYNVPLYNFIRDNGGWDNWDMVLIETRNCSSMLEALKFEREYFEMFNATLNIKKPNGMINRKDNLKIYMKSYNKKYKEENKERLDSLKKEKITCPVCGSTINRDEKARHERSNKHQAAAVAPIIETVGPMAAAVL